MKCRHGFTLIEILIVLLIISIVMGMAVMSIHTNQNKRAEMLADQLVNVIRLAEQEAMLRPATLGLGLTENTYTFYRYQPDPDPKQPHWIAISAGPLSRHVFSSSLAITVNINGQTVALDNEPHIMISPNGDITPFILRIGKINSPPHYQVTGQENGDITREYAHEEE